MPFARRRYRRFARDDERRERCERRVRVHAADDAERIRMAADRKELEQRSAEASVPGGDEEAVCLEVLSLRRKSGAFEHIYITSSCHIRVPSTRAWQPPLYGNHP